LTIESINWLCHSWKDLQGISKLGHDSHKMTTMVQFGESCEHEVEKHTSPISIDGYDGRTNSICQQEGKESMMYIVGPILQVVFLAPSLKGQIVQKSQYPICERHVLRQLMRLNEICSKRTLRLNGNTPSDTQSNANAPSFIINTPRKELIKLLKFSLIKKLTRSPKKKRMSSL